MKINTNIAIKGKLLTNNEEFLNDFISPYNSDIILSLIENNVEFTESNKDYNISSNIFGNNLAITEFKPTSGLISKYGVLVNSPSLENILLTGNNTKEVKDIFESIIGYSANDLHSVKKELIEEDLGLVCFNKNKYAEDIIKLSNYSLVNSTTKTIFYSEFSSEYAKYTGLIYGKDLGTITYNRTSFFSNNSKENIIIGNYLNSKNNKIRLNAYILRNNITTEINKLLSNKVLIEIVDKKGLEELHSLASLSGLPIITLNNKGSFIVIIGKRYTDLTLLNISKMIMEDLC